MILVVLIAILMTGGIAAWIAGKKLPEASRWISLIAVFLDFVLLLAFIVYNSPNGNLMAEISKPWIPGIGISFHLSMDGLSFIMLLMTFFIGLLAVIISWREINENTGFYHFNLLWILAGIAGVFVAVDLFLFYFFWEIMLIPMYFLIGIWGHENRIYASFKFFIFTQASGLLMFIAIIALYLIHGANTGTYTFDYVQLLGTSLPKGTETLLMLGFLAAFLVKLPVVPFHTWLPDAHTEAPTAGSLILAALMLKTGAYGLLRFIIPLFPNASMLFAPVGMVLGVAGILYGAKLAFAQTDFKRLVAYTSINHMGFIILGVFALNDIAFQGVVIQIVTHGLSTGALFIVAGQLAERTHTRNLDKMGGLWEHLPEMGGKSLVFVMASLGLPGLGNFIAEFLTLLGAFRSHVALTCIACLGLILGTVYSIRIMQKVFFGPYKGPAKTYDLTTRENLVLSSLVGLIILLGLFPAPVIQLASPALEKILQFLSI